MRRSSAGFSKLVSRAGRPTHHAIGAMFGTEVDPATKKVIGSVCDKCKRLLRDKKLSVILFSKHMFSCTKVAYSDRLAAWNGCVLLQDKLEPTAPTSIGRLPSSVILKTPVHVRNMPDGDESPSTPSTNRPQMFFTNLPCSDESLHLRSLL